MMEMVTYMRRKKWRRRVKKLMLKLMTSQIFF
jgi:hypothetical protein